MADVPDMQKVPDEAKREEVNYVVDNVMWDLFSGFVGVATYAILINLLGSTFSWYGIFLAFFFAIFIREGTRWMTSE